MAVLDPEKLMLKDGTTVADRLRAFGDALVAHDKRAIVVMIDEEGEYHLTGHLPKDNAEIVKILEDAAKMLREGKTCDVAFPRRH